MTVKRTKKKTNIKLIVAGCAAVVIAGVAILSIFKFPMQKEKEAIPETVEDKNIIQTEEPQQTTQGEVTTPSEPATTSSDVKNAKPTGECSPYCLYDTVFFGDSRTLGLSDFKVVPEAEVIASRGIALSKVGEKAVIEEGDKKITMIDALKKASCKRVFLMFGLNELGWPYEETFKDAYRKLISQVKDAQPNAKIYVQGIFPMTEGRTDEIYNNENIAKFNGYIKAVAKEAGVAYIDISPAVVNENGTLPREGSDDGIHLNKEYCGKWMKFISEIVKGEEGRE